MHWIALVGPEIEENLSLRYLASSLRPRAPSDIVAFNTAEDFGRAVARIVDAHRRPCWSASRSRSSGGRPTSSRSPSRCDKAATAATSPRAATSGRSPPRDHARLPRARLRLPPGGGGDTVRSPTRSHTARRSPGSPASRSATARAVVVTGPRAARPRHAPVARSPRRAGRVLRPRHRAARVEPRLLRELLVLLHRRVARAEPARQALPPARASRTSPTRWSRCKRDARHRHLRLPRRQLLRPRPQARTSSASTRSPTRSSAAASGSSRRS